MYSVFKNNVIIFLLITIIACDEPIPIEIKSSEEEVELTIVNNDPSSYVITGYDSTGIIEENAYGASVISISGIKNTIGKITVYKGYGQAIFFDTNKPVLNLSDRLIGFKTFRYGSVKFDNKIATVLPYYLRYKDKSVIMDTLVGVKHVITYDKVLSAINHDFPYNSNVTIEITDDVGNSNLLNIRLPAEIVGKVEIIGDNINKDQAILLSWDQYNANYDDLDGIIAVEIIVGGITQDRDELIPLFTASRFNSNRLEIKNSLVKEVIASGRFEYLVFTFLRKIRKSNSTNRFGEIYFASQSIHNIWIKI